MDHHDSEDLLAPKHLLNGIRKGVDNLDAWCFLRSLHLSHADGSGLLPEALPKLTALSWEEIRLALILDIGAKLGST